MNEILVNFNPDEWLEVGTIIAAQGLKGEVRVKPDSDFPERFLEPGMRWLKSPHSSQIRQVELETGRSIPGKNIYVLQLTGIEDRNQAEALRGYKLFVSAQDRLPLEDNEYHVNDLINLVAINQQTGKAIGKVIDVFSAGNDLLEVELYPPNNITPSEPPVKTPSPPQPVRVLIPFVEAIVPVVDLAKGHLEITPPPGLLEVNQK